MGQLPIPYIGYILSICTEGSKEAAVTPQRIEVNKQPLLSSRHAGDAFLCLYLNLNFEPEIITQNGDGQLPPKMVRKKSESR